MATGQSTTWAIQSPELADPDSLIGWPVWVSVNLLASAQHKEMAMNFLSEVEFERFRIQIKE